MLLIPAVLTLCVSSPARLELAWEKSFAMSEGHPVPTGGVLQRGNSLLFRDGGELCALSAKDGSWRWRRSFVGEDSPEKRATILAGAPAGRLATASWSATGSDLFVIAEPDGSTISKKHSEGRFAYWVVKNGVAIGLSGYLDQAPSPPSKEHLWLIDISAPRKSVLSSAAVISRDAAALLRKSNVRDFTLGGFAYRLQRNVWQVADVGPKRALEAPYASAQSSAVFTLTPGVLLAVSSGSPTPLRTYQWADNGSLHAIWRSTSLDASTLGGVLDSGRFWGLSLAGKLIVHDRYGHRIVVVPNVQQAHEVPQTHLLIALRKDLSSTLLTLSHVPELRRLNVPEKEKMPSLLRFAVDNGFIEVINHVQHCTLKKYVIRLS
jgi:hypothetical protein